MGRNKGIDFFRAFAIIHILLYHFYVYCGYPFMEHRILNRLLCVGGEVGVTLFYLISGFGIYNSIMNMEKKTGESVSWFCFMKKRLRRIAPEYYAAIVVLLLLTDQARYLSLDGGFQILTHIFFIHNLFPETVDKFSGVWWTLGVIVQFYIIAIPLYKVLKKHTWVIVWIILITILTKAVVYGRIANLNIKNTGVNLFFLYGRQLYTAIDNFAVGMLVCKLMDEADRYKRELLFISFGALFGLIILIAMTEKYSPYTNTVYGYVWHSALAICLAIIMFWGACGFFEWPEFIYKGIGFVAKYQYGIYIWHHLIATNLLNNSLFIKSLSQHYFSICFLLIACICTMAGYVSSKCFSR